MELWHVGILGMKSGKSHILQKMWDLHFLIIFVELSFSTFPLEVRHHNDESNAIVCALILFIPSPIIPQFQHSNIPSGA
jgi:hypothetical protein